MADTYVQVAPDSTGKKIRNLSLDILQADGTIATVYMQVVAIANSDGTPVNLDMISVLEEMLVELRQIRLGMQLLTDDDLDDDSGY